MHRFFLLLALLATLRPQAQNFAPVDAWLNQHLQELGGRAVLLICKDGRIVYQKEMNQQPARRQELAQRFRNQRRSPALPDSFNAQSSIPIASSSKWLSAALILTIVDEGKLRLSDTVGTWLPEMTQQGKGGITIAQCLSHTTGLDGGSIRDGIGLFRGAENMNEAVRRMANLPIEGLPGTVFHYGNTGLQLAAAVIEKISGKSFNRLFQERIAEPLQLTQTNWGNRSLPLAAGGAHSSASDYLRFLEMIRNKGKTPSSQILKAATIQQMCRNQIGPQTRIALSPSRDRQLSGYGFGCWVPTDRSNYSLAASPGLFGSFPWINFDKNYSAVLWVYNLRARNRQEHYQTLRQLVDAAFP